MYFHAGMVPPAVLVWYYHPTMSTTSKQTWVMWCCSSSVSTERSIGLIKTRIWCRNTSSSLSFCLTDMQSLLPSSFESSGHVFLAPRWPFLSLLMSLLCKTKLLTCSIVSAGNTASVCSSLTTTLSFCRTFSPSCWTSPLNLMSVSASAGLSGCYCCCCRHTREMVSSAVSFVAGDQGLIHNLILDSRIIGQLASRVWKNRDLNAWVSLLLRYTLCKNKL